MKKLALKVGLAGLLVSSVALGAGTWSTNSVTITQLEVDPTSGGNGTSTWLGFNTMPNNKPTCASGSQANVYGSADHVRSLTSVATAAFLAGRTVRVNWNGSCTGNYGQITHLLVE
jgi:hypothetical protein